MNVLTLALLFHVMASHGMIWEGACASWAIAVILDAALFAFIIFRVTEPKR